MSQAVVRKSAKLKQTEATQSTSVDLQRDHMSQIGVEAVFKAAKQSGFLDGKIARITGRISPMLVAQAKKRTGIESDSQLIEYALASVALEDNFAAAFRKSRGTIDPTLDLDF